MAPSGAHCETQKHAFFGDKNHRIKFICSAQTDTAGMRDNQ